MPSVTRGKEDSESPSEDKREDYPCIAWSGLSRKIPVLVFYPEAIVIKDGDKPSIGEQYNMAFKIVRTESRLVRGILTNHGFHEVHPNSNDFNLMWTGSHLKPYLLHSLQDFQKVNHFPRSYELTRKDRLYKNIQRMQQAHGFKNFHIVPQTFVLPSEYQEFCSHFAKDKGAWIIKPVASSRGRGIYLVSSPSQISMDENILVSRYINNPLLIDDFKFDVRLYVLVTSYDPLLIYVYEEGLARFATVKYDRTTKNIKNQFMHLTNYSVNKKSSDYVSCDDAEVEDYGNKWSMSAMLRYLKQEGKDTTLLMNQVEDLIIKAVLSAELQIATACKMFVPHRGNCFELYGFDVLIDSNLKPWLLEVNLSPSLACDAPLDLKIKASMISDMLSLVGFVCQDPLLRQQRSDRGGLDLGLKHPAPKTQHVSSAQTSTAHTRVRQRPMSANNVDTEGFKDKLGGKQGQGDGTLGLTAEEIKVLRRIKEEYERRGGFIRIFPTPDTWELYSGYLESKTSMNSMLANRLFHERLGRIAVPARPRVVSCDVQLQVEIVQTCHVFQYERKLLSLETRKRRRRHPGRRSTARKNKSGGLARDSKASPTENNCGDVEEGEELVKAKPEKEKHSRQPSSNRAPAAVWTASSLKDFHSEALSLPGATRSSAKPRVQLLEILQEGWDLSKVQARVAFASYLHRVQQRLLAESSTNTAPSWPERDNDQMELVIRFLRRAASNLQQDVKMTLPSRQLPPQERQRVLSLQLREFINCYNKETEHMIQKQESGEEEERCVNPSVFEAFIAEANENDLEEVLTFYTHKNQSASIFLGTKVCGVRKDICERNHSGELVRFENPKILPAAKEVSSSSDASLSADKGIPDLEAKATGRPPSVCTPTGDHQPGSRRGKAQPEAQALQPSSSFPARLGCTHLPLRNRPASPESLPLHCPPPPPPSQPPAYTETTAAPQLYPPRPAASSVTQTPPVVSKTVSRGLNAAPAPQHPEGLRRILPLSSKPTSSASNVAATSSMPSAVHIYSQRLSRPTSAGQVIRRNSLGKLRPEPTGVFKELNSLSAQAQSNQQAIISALQKLADKQAARHYASSSHINLLTQHLTNLNLASGMLSRGGFTLGPKPHPGPPVSQEPVRAVHSDTAPSITAGQSLLRGDEGRWDEEMQGAYSRATGAGPQQQNQPAQRSYQLQFAIQQLQQQRLKSQQILDQSRCRYQAVLPDQTNAQCFQAPQGPSSNPPASRAIRPNHAQNRSPVQPWVGPALTPKPPSSAREGMVRKTTTQRLYNRQTSSESPANGAASSGEVAKQQVAYEVACAKTGLSVYSKLFPSQGPKHR